VTLWNPVGSPQSGFQAAGSTTFVTPLTTVNVGDQVLISTSYSGGSNGPIVSGGGCSWTNASAVPGNTNGDPFYSNLGSQIRSSLYFGTVVTPGTTNMTITVSSTSVPIAFAAQDFSYTGATSYSQDGGAGSWTWTGGSVSGGSGTLGPFTPTGTGKELFAAVVSGFPVATPGAGYVAISDSHDVTTLVYSLDVDAAGGPYSPGFTSGPPNSQFGCCFEAAVAPTILNNIVMML
jgi:hypothetical protein